MSTGAEPGHLHPRPTERNGYRYFFYDKHHGRGGPEAAAWAHDVTEDDEFGVFNQADLLDLSDEHGNFYGIWLQTEPQREIRFLGTLRQQIAKFPLGAVKVLFPCLRVFGMTRRHQIHGRRHTHGGGRVAYVGERGVGIGVGGRGRGGFRALERVPASLGRGSDVKSDRARRRRPAVETDGAGPANRADRPSRGRRETDELPHQPGAAPRRRTAVRRKKSPAVLEQLPRLIEPEAGGDPGGKRKFVRVSLRRLARQLKTICHVTVGRLLRKLKFSLKTNVKRLTGPPHPDRDRQFRWIGKLRGASCVLVHRLSAPTPRTPC